MFCLIFVFRFLIHVDGSISTFIQRWVIIHESFHMKDVHKELVIFLEQEYLRRKNTNSSYSLRAFAKFLGIDQSILSKVLKRQRNLSFKTWEKCLLKLDIDPSQKGKLFRLWDKEIVSLDVDELSLKALSNWRYWAVMETLKLNENITVEVIVKKLCLSENEVVSILQDLIQLEFVCEENDKYVLLRRDNHWLSLSATAEHRRSLQKQFLLQSLKALEAIPMEERFHGSLTFAIDPKDLPTIQMKFAMFLKSLGRYANRSNAEVVYQSTLSLFPLKDSYAKADDSSL